MSNDLSRNDVPFCREAEPASVTDCEDTPNGEETAVGPVLPVLRPERMTSHIGRVLAGSLAVHTDPATWQTVLSIPPRPGIAGII